MTTMRAFVLTAPREAEVLDVSRPVAAAGQVVVDVERVGVCGTDVEFFTGEMSYLHDGQAAFPLRLGHEWCGVVSSVGVGVDSAWVGRRVTGDTMLGCGECRRCRRGRQHVCESRYEVGIRGGFAGSLAEQLAVPASSLHALPADLDPAVGALVEPAGNALRSLRAAAVGPGDRLLVLGAGTIGLLVALMARADGVEVHVVDRSDRALGFAGTLGVQSVWPVEAIPNERYDAVVDASNSADLPARAVHLVEPGGRVVYIGLAGQPSWVDSRALVLADVTAVGVLSASPGLAGAIELFVSGAVRPATLVAATVGLDGVGAVLAGERPSGAGGGPKIHVDPRR